MASDESPEWLSAVTKAILQALKERDAYTYGHCRRVGRNARLLAQAAGLNEFEQRAIELAGTFHDLGKIGIPDSVLLKNTRLNAKEEAIMRSHPLRSVEILTPLSHLPLFRATLPGIRFHHERIDGAGYPDGIAGENIPLAARIILIADTFDAMTTTRIYRRGMSNQLAYKELQIFSGRQFDSELVKIFLQAHPNWGPIEEEITEKFIASLSRKKAA